MENQTAACSAQSCIGNALTSLPVDQERCACKEEEAFTAHYWLFQWDRLSSFTIVRDRYVAYAKARAPFFFLRARSAALFQDHCRKQLLFSRTDIPYFLIAMLHHIHFQKQMYLAVAYFELNKAYIE